MNFTKATISWSVKQVVRMIEENKMSFDNPVQRGKCWNKNQKSALIESVLLGYPIPQIYAKKALAADDVNFYDVLDGKQRLTTFYDYVNNAFALADNVNTVDGEEIKGLKFKDLSEDFQDRIYSCMLSIVYFDGITDYEEKEIFKRLNGGKSISLKQLSIANCNNLDDLVAFNEKMLLGEILTKKAMVNKMFVPFLMKLHMMFTRDISEVVFSGVQFNEYVKTEVLSPEDLEELSSFLDDAYEVLLYMDDDAAVKLYTTELHFISLAPFIRDMLKKKIPYKQIAEDITRLANSDLMEEYKQYCSNSTAKNWSIKNRHNILQKFF